MTTEAKLQAILQHILDEEVDMSKLDANLEADYDMDSMDAVEITDRIEREFGIEIETKNIYTMKTVGDLLNAIENLQESS